MARATFAPPGASSPSSAKPARLCAGFSFGGYSNGLMFAAQVIGLGKHGVIKRLSELLPRVYVVAAAARPSRFAQEPPSQTYGHPKMAPRGTASCFHPSYRILTAFHIVLIFFLSPYLPVMLLLAPCCHVILTVATVCPLHSQPSSSFPLSHISAASGRGIHFHDCTVLSSHPLQTK